ncbi:MAG: M28 family metallopeptidase [Nocardioides sp.]
MSKRFTTAAAAALTVALVGASATVPSHADPNNNTVRKLTQAVTADGVLEHLAAFQGIADDDGDRAAGRPGYDASVDYVVEQLEAAGYDPTIQEFPFTYAEESSELERLSPSPRVFVEGVEFLRNTFDSGTPQGEATGPMSIVDPGSATSGCEAADFAGFAPGDIALIQRGGCAFALKALNAEAAGAAGAIIWNNQAGLVNMIGDATGLTIPVVFASEVAGLDLTTTPGAIVRVLVDFAAEERTTYNVLAQTSRGRDDNVVMAGAHLDSVQDGAGINDNGSGSAALLETAIQMAKVKPKNAVRFAWWGAEEEGLLGSTYYVEQLSEEQAEDIALYLNFDMVASPNYMFGIYDGDNSGGTAAPGFIPPGSAEIEDVFEQFYASRGEPSQDSEFSGRSDYGPFIAVGIPAGGLFTGAEVAKTAAEAALYGGVAGASYDPCYHQACDNLTGAGQDVALYDQLREDYTLVGNVNRHALDVNSDAIATAVLTFAYDTSTVNGEPGHPGRGQLKDGRAQQMLLQAQSRSAR